MLGRVFLAVLATLAAPRASACSLTSASGVVQLRRELSGPWVNPERLPIELRPGDQLRTGLKALAVLRFDDGSEAALEADAAFALEDSSPGRSSMRLYMGRLKALARSGAEGRFEVHTPAASCVVRATEARGTEFRVAVLAGGATRVDVLRGVLGVEDNRGSQTLLHPRQSLLIDRSGMGVPQRLPTSEEDLRRRVRSFMRRELDIDAARREGLAQAAREGQLSELQQGKALLDARGRRVRVEEYVLRPRPDQFKYVSLSETKGGLSYFYYAGTFNRALPPDLGLALRDLGGRADAAPEYYLVSYEAGRWSGGNSMRQAGLGGHPVDVNSNVDADDDVSSILDSSSNRFVDVSGRAVYETLFDSYGLYLNGKLKYGRSGSAISSDSEAVLSTDRDPLTGAALDSTNAWLAPGGSLPFLSQSVTFPDAGRARQTVYQSFSDGTFVRWENYGLDGSRSDASPGEAGPLFRAGLTAFNLEQSVTASEFGGRAVETVAGPRLPLQAGLIP